MRMVLTPPVLPPFLAGTFNLKPVEGVPSDEEVKMVHAVIRALNDVANVPVLYDPDLAMQLSMHLFSIQMTRYRDIHPCIIFPSNITHTPPQLPAHIPVELEQVTGPPSDEQIKSVQTALRLSENLANVPSMFDADLSMKLSQHLFDIQFERYLHKIADEGPPVSVTSSQAGGADVNGPDGAGLPGVQNYTMESDQEHSDRNGPATETTGSGPIRESTEACPCDPVSRSSVAARNTLELLEPIRETKQSVAELLKNGQEDMKKLLVEVRDGLNDAKQVLIVTQQSMARGLNARYHNARSVYTLLNAQGEEPYLLGLPSFSELQSSLVYTDTAQDSDIAQYLRFYGLGVEFIEDGDELKIKAGKREAAKAKLKSYFSS